VVGGGGGGGVVDWHVIVTVSVNELVAVNNEPKASGEPLAVQPLGTLTDIAYW
jgi:hypothetical protein